MINCKFKNPIMVHKKGDSNLEKLPSLDLEINFTNFTFNPEPYVFGRD